MDDQLAALESLAPGFIDRLGRVSGVEGVALGGSRARGTHTATSDFDLGVYYRGGLDIAALQVLANAYSEVDTTVTEHGGWGPWMDGGAWLVIGGTPVDLIYRNVDRVANVWSDCQAGRYTNEMQTGHPLGFWSHAYAGELALAIPTDTMSTRLTDLRAEMAVYPAELSRSLVTRLWEAGFASANAKKAVPKLDVAYVAGSLFRAAGVTAHALHGHAHRWLINEKGAIASAAALPAAGPRFAERVADVFVSIRADADALEQACRDMQSIVDDVAANLSK